MEVDAVLLASFSGTSVKFVHPILLSLGSTDIKALVSRRAPPSRDTGKVLIRFKYGCCLVA